MFAKTALKCLIIPFLVLSSPSWAGESSVSGFIGAETRIFTQNPKHSGQKNNPELSAIFSPEFRYSSNNNRFSLIPFYRRDSRDDARSHFDIREGYWMHTADDWQILTGINKVFWGVTESRHLVDIINQTDLIEDIDGEDKLGQPMISLTRYNNWGQLDFYVLPGFRERSFAGTSGRFRGPLVIDTDNAQYESSQDEKHIDFAARWSHYFGDWDVGLSHFYGTSREPRFITNTAQTKLLPVYDIINQTGVDVQYTNEAWLWKFEAIARQGQGDTFTAATGGFEHTFYQVSDSAADIGVLAEYHFDGRHHDAPAVPFDNDLFAGVRLSLNDIQDTDLLAGVSVDPSSSEISYSVEAERRIGDNYTIELRARFFSGSDAGEDGFALEQDDYIQLQFKRHF